MNRTCILTSLTFVVSKMDLASLLAQLVSILREKIVEGTLEM